MLDERANVLPALAQRRNVQVGDLDAIEQVLAELAAVDHSGEVAVGGRNDAHVHTGRRRIRAHGMHLAVLEEAKQHRLHAQRHLRDLVEEDGAAVGLLELADLVAIGAGEAAFHVPEELRFEERLGKAGAVERYITLVGAR